MRIAIVSDAWEPQVNGVVRTLTALAKAMEGRGVEIEFLTPEGMPTVALPSYPGIRLALRYRKAINHIALARLSPLGKAGRIAAQALPFPGSLNVPPPPELVGGAP